MLLDPQSAEVGRTAVARVGGVDNIGNAIAVPGVTWRSSAPNVASVSPLGAIAALNPGVASIIATSGTLSAAADFTVSTFAIPSMFLRIAPNDGTIPLGGSVQLSATLVSATGETVPVPTAVWVTSQPGIVSVTPTGLVTGVGSGSAVVSATANGLTGTVTVVVSPRVDPALAVRIAAPIPDAILADHLRIVVTVIKDNVTARLSRVDAMLDQAVIPLDTVRLGAMGGVQGWGKELALSNVPIGIHRLIVTAYSLTNEIAADTVWFTREVPQTGGNPPEGGKKQLRPPRRPGVDSAAIGGCLLPKQRKPVGHDLRDAPCRWNRDHQPAEQSRDPSSWRPGGRGSIR